MLQEYEIQFRVRYQETDAQGRVHHANYINYFEMGRVELLRARGFSYWKLEESGVILVVTEISCRYYQPAKFDDLLRLKTRVVRIGGARIEHEYAAYRADELLAEGHSVVACVDPAGKAQRLPTYLR